MSNNKHDHRWVNDRSAGNRCAAIGMLHHCCHTPCYGTLHTPQRQAQWLREIGAPVDDSDRAISSPSKWAFIFIWSAARTVTKCNIREKPTFGESRDINSITLTRCQPTNVITASLKTSGNHSLHHRRTDGAISCRAPQNLEANFSGKHGFMKIELRGDGPQICSCLYHVVLGRLPACREYPKQQANRRASFVLIFVSLVHNGIGRPRLAAKRTNATLDNGLRGAKTQRLKASYSQRPPRAHQRRAIER